MTPTVQRPGPDPLSAAAPSRERPGAAGAPGGDFATVFGALRQAPLVRLPERLQHEPPRAAAPAAPEPAPVNEPPRAEAPAAPEAAPAPSVRPRHPRQPAPGAGSSKADTAATASGQPLGTAAGSEAARAAASAELSAADAPAPEAAATDPAAPLSAAGLLPMSVANAPLPAPDAGERRLTGDDRGGPKAVSAADALATSEAPEPATVAAPAPAAAELLPAALPPATPLPLHEPAAAVAGPEPGAPRAPEVLPSAAASTPPLAPASASTSPSTQAALALPPQHPGFAEELSAQLSVWTRQGVQEAELRLNPAELGPVQVRIQVEGQQAQVRFVAEAAPTRDALEAALPDLAAALQREGLQLTGGSVQSQAQHQQQQQRDQAATLSPGRAARGSERVAELPAAPPARPASQRLLDLYA